MPSRQQEFMNQAYWDARVAGLPDPQARLAAAQAALETGYGRSVKGNNYYGIKAGPSWEGPVVNARTWEDVGGRRVNQNANFRAYDNPIDSFRDWASTIGNRWSAAMTAPTFREAVSALNPGRPGGYATDRNYGSKLGYINERFDPDPMGIMAAIDPPDIPTPTPRPDPNPMGIMAAIDPPTPMAVERGGLLDAPSFTPPNEVTYGGLLGPSMPSFDMGRFGPAPSAFKETPVASFAPATFDMERFGPQIQTPTAPSSVLDRMGTVQPVAQGMAELQRGLLDQQLAAGILPDIPPSLIDPAPVASVPGYRDPMVAAQPQFKAPVIEEVPQPPAPQIAGPASVQPQISAPVPTLSPAQQTFNQRSALGAPAPSLLGPQMARDVQRQMGARSMIGGIGGALLGGALLGPIGGLLGGLAGRTYANRTYHPPAPEPVKGQPQQTFTKGESSYGNLNDYGQQAYSDSGQFAAAVDSGMAGLW